MQLPVGLPSQTLGSTPGHLGFMVDEAAVGQTFLQVLLYSLVSIVLQNLDTHQFTHH